METGLDLLGVVGFVVGVLALSAGVTYAVVRVDALVRARRSK